MPATDIRISTGFPDHWKTKKLTRRTSALGVICLLRLWSYAAESKPHGDLSGMTAEDIEIAAGWDGEPGAFIAALCECRFIDQADDGVYSLHDWQEHNPWAYHAAERSGQARRAAEARWSNAHSCSTDADRMPPASDTHTERNAPIPNPIPTPNPTPTPKKKEIDTNVSIIGIDHPDDMEPEEKATENEKSNGKIPLCPHQEIIDLYHEKLPELSRVQVWNDPYRGYLRTRWKEERERQSLSWWMEFFKSIRGSPFLLGDNNNGWKANLGWIVRPSNFQKILNGNYREDALTKKYGKTTAKNLRMGAEWLRRHEQEGEP